MSALEYRWAKGWGRLEMPGGSADPARILPCATENAPATLTRSGAEPRSIPLTRRNLIAIDVEPGLCGCGCGRPTPIAKRSDTRAGHVKGEPIRFIYGHHHRLKRGTVEERFLSRVQKGAPGECWEWTGWLSDKGYGTFWDDGQVKAHRTSYELHVGPIPEGLEIDHLCRNRSCVNPEHLEPVTHAENCRRAAERREGDRR